MTEAKLRQSVVDVMLGWLGANRGDAKHKDILSVYNSYKPLPRGHKMTVNDHFCVATACAAYIKAGLDKITVIECSASKLVELAKAKGIWVEDDKHVPKPGDIVIYDWQDGTNYASSDNTGVPDHAGVVETVDAKAGAMTILEGNRPLGKVARHPLMVNGRYIRGYVCPDFASIATPEKTITEIAREVIDGKWGNGAERKRRLTEAGYDYDAVQAEVNRILSEAKPVKVLPAKSFSIAVARKYTAKTELVLRCGPGVGYAAIKTLPKGTVVRCYGFYTRANSVRWLYVRVNNSSVVGYADERMLSK
jgi:hypothetical protein